LLYIIYLLTKCTVLWLSEKKTKNGQPNSDPNANPNCNPIPNQKTFSLPQYRSLYTSASSK